MKQFLPLIPLIASCAAVARAADAGQDTSGTNPTLLLRTLGLGNEYFDMPAGNWLDTVTLKYTEPFADGRMSLRLNTPFNWAEGGENGFGDLSLKWTWVASVTPAAGWVLTAEATAPTGADRFSADQWIIAPGITYAWFVSPEVIIAPAYVHGVGFSGNGRLPDIHSGTADLYVVYRPAGQKWWLTGDFTAGIDYENTDKTPMSFELQIGCMLGMAGKASVNGFIRPGVGIGSDRPYDWNIETGITIIGF